MIVSQVRAISRELIANEVRKHMEKVVEEAVEKQSSLLKQNISRLYENEIVSHYKELKDEIETYARRITNEVLVNAKDSINKALNNVISDMVLNRLKPSK